MSEQPKQEQNGQGPLSKLTDKAVKSKFIQKVHENVPSSAKTYIQKGTVPATKAIAAVDQTLQTDEAQRVATSAFDLLNAVSALTLLVLTWTVSNLESSLKIDSNPSNSNENDEQEQEQGENDGENTRENIQSEQAEAGKEKTRSSELNEHYHEAILLLYRYRVVAYTLFAKASECCSKKSENNNNTDQKEEQRSYDPHSIDKVVVKHAKRGIQLAKTVSAYSLNQASKFSGPGSTTIAPAANYIISKLPDDAKRSVKESTSPFQ